MKAINDLLNTSERRKLFEIILHSDREFTSRELQQALQQQGMGLTITSIQTFLNGLTYRGYLSLTPVKTSKERGRATFYFRRNVNYSLPVNLATVARA